MKSVEFETRIRNGIITVPDKYGDFINNYAKIILIAKEEGDEEKKSKYEMQSLLDSIIEKKVFDDIDDPVSWQKKLRDEWE